MKVLIAYFHPLLCDAMANTVRKYGHAVDTTYTVAESMPALKNAKPAVLVVGPSFADGSLDTVLDYARAQRPSPTVFAVLPEDRPGLRAELASKGALRQFVLPLKTDELANAVRDVEKARFPFREPRGGFAG